MIAQLSSGDPVARARAACGLRELGDEAAAVRHSSWIARRNAAWALGAIGDSRAVDALLPALKDAHAGVRRQAAWAIGVLGR